MNVNGASAQVKACNQLVPAGHPLYYYHCKTALYNDIFLCCRGQVYGSYLQPGVSVDECYKYSRFGVSFQSEVSEVCYVCCALLSWWPTMPYNA